MSFLKLTPDILQTINENDSVLIDVRSKAEFDEGHANHALNFDVEDMIASKLPNIQRHKPIYVYCRTGRRSEIAKTLLTRAGYTKVENIGGLSEISVLL